MIPVNEYLPVKELQSFFKQNLQTYTTKHKIELEIANGTGITTASGLSYEPDKGYKGLLLTDPVELDQFIIAYKLKTTKDLEKIMQGMLWIRYLIGKAEVSYEVPELEAALTFRVVKSKMIIYCHALHYFDESEVLFTMEHYFENYISQNREKLEEACLFKRSK